MTTDLKSNIYQMDIESAPPTSSEGASKQRPQEEIVDNRIEPPKKSLSAFMIFSRERRNHHKGKSQSESMKLIGSEWHKLSSTEKQLYEEKSKADRERYLMEIQSLPPDAQFKLPKQMIVQQVRPNLLKEEGAVFNDIMRGLGQKWKQMNDDEKEPYIRLSEMDKVRFKLEQEEYIKVKQIMIANKEVRRDKSGKPKKPLTAYQIYAHSMRKRLRAKKPHASESDRMKAISIEWAKLSNEQKKFYHEEAKHDKEKFEKAIVEWENSLNNKQNKQILEIEERRKQGSVSFFSHGLDFGEAAQSLFKHLSPPPTSKEEDESPSKIKEADENMPIMDDLDQHFGSDFDKDDLDDDEDEFDSQMQSPINEEDEDS